VPDEDDRPRDASSAADAGWSDPDQADTSWADAAAPDDISELGRDIHAYYRERRAARRRELIRRFARRRGAIPVSATVAVIAVAAIVATLLSVLGPSRPSRSTAPLPLAATSVPAGEVGGLLPAVSLESVKGPSVSSLGLRPAVVALLPPNCTFCSPLVPDLAKAAATQHVQLYAVAPAKPSADADSLAGQGLSSDSVFYDANGTLAARVRTNGLTLVEVNRNGVIVAIEKEVTAAVGSGPMKAALVKMLAQPGTRG
jgi:hypothetical protein